MSDRTDGLSGELLALKDGDGRINAASAVKWARRHPKSQLHAALQWDDKKAGEAHRIWQVRALIAVHITDADGGRRFISLSVDRAEGGYRPVEDVLGRADLRKIMLEDALGELERMQRKYTVLQELHEVWSARDRVARRSRARVVSGEAAD